MKSILALAALIFMVPASAHDEHAFNDRCHSIDDDEDAYAYKHHADAAYDHAYHAAQHGDYRHAARDYAHAVADARRAEEAARHAAIARHHARDAEERSYYYPSHHHGH